ncbi:MAG: tRNA 5'-guanylyltransferase [Methanosarcinaceae archaeon]|nr:tRNA 5'-guanylyltransferase [Methanosarcinaceae archaeon]
MKKREIYADLRCVPPVIIRVDGRNFKNTLIRLNFEKPYDKRFASAMADAVELLFKKSGLSPIFAYMFSDEINFLFQDVSFDGRIEKLDSVIPSFMSSALTMLLKLDEPISFDSRVLPVNFDYIHEYMKWRQREAWRNCISSYGYYTMRLEGLSEADAAAFMMGKKGSHVHDLLFKRGINLSKVPAWQRRGIMVHKDEYEVTGFNPVLNERTTTTRTKVVQNWDVPLFESEEGRLFLNYFILREENLS